MTMRVGRLGLAAGWMGMLGGMAVAVPPGEVPSPAAPSTATTVATAPAAPTAEGPVYVLGHTVKDLDGKDVDLSTFKGKVLLIVNVASQCGLTTAQYAGLQKAYDARKDQGLVVIAFPANNFREQEPGSNADIKSFCTNKKVTFPVMEKISVLGADQHPLFKQLSEAPAPAGGKPTWNFTKYLVNRRGEVVQRLDPRVAPDSEDVLKQIDALLAEAPASAPQAPAASPASGGGDGKSGSTPGSAGGGH